MASKNNHKPPIVLWEEKDGVQYVVPDGKIFLCNFNKVITTQLPQGYDKFMIDKTSYEKQLIQICRYINYFINMYDHEHELMMGYLHLKYIMDIEKSFRLPELPPSDDNSVSQLTVKEIEKKRDEIIDSFISFVYGELFESDNHIVENIKKLVYDNYLDDVEKNDGKKKHADKEYLESLEFTNEHVQLMLMISFGMKIICPIMFHFFYINKIKLTKDTNLIFRFYKPLFDGLFNDHVNMFNKLFVYVKSRVLESASINSPMFDKRQITGIDPFLVIHMFVNKVIISENMVKYAFPENFDEVHGKYKENIPGFNKTIIKFQLNYFIKEVYEKNLTEVTNVKNSEGLSGADKMEMNIRKMDEGKALIADLNAKWTTEMIKDILDFPVMDNEVDYMIDNWYPSDLQIRLINTYYASFYGNYRDTNLLTRKDWYYLAVLLKKKLLFDAGWEAHISGESDVDISCALPYVLTGNMEGKMNSRIIRNNKYMNKLEDDIHYIRLIDEEYSAMLQIPSHQDEVRGIISSIINSRFTYVTPEEPDRTGETIEYSEEKIGAEIIYFLFNQ